MWRVRCKSSEIVYSPILKVTSYSIDYERDTYLKASLW